MPSSAQLRKDIRRSGVPLAEIARQAGVALTTLHSFVKKDGSEMRASNFEKVADVLARLKAEAAGSQRRGVREDATAFEAEERISIELRFPSERLSTLQSAGADIQAIARAGAEKALKEAEARAWADANREAIDAYNKWIEKHGTLAEQLGLI